MLVPQPWQGCSSGVGWRGGGVGEGRGVGCLLQGKGTFVHSIKRAVGGPPPSHLGQLCDTGGLSSFQPFPGRQIRLAGPNIHILFLVWSLEDQATIACRTLKPLCSLSTRLSPDTREQCPDNPVGVHAENPRQVPSLTGFPEEVAAVLILRPRPARGSTSLPRMQAAGRAPAEA